MYSRGAPEDAQSSYTGGLTPGTSIGVWDEPTRVMRNTLSQPTGLPEQHVSTALESRSDGVSWLPVERRTYAIKTPPVARRTRPPGRSGRLTEPRRWDHHFSDPVTGKSFTFRPLLSPRACPGSQQRFKAAAGTHVRGQPAFAKSKKARPSLLYFVL